MQQKINYFIWAFVVALIIIFGILTISNRNKIKEFKYTTSKPYNIDIRVYLKDPKVGKRWLNLLKKELITNDSIIYLNSLTNKLKTNNIDKYLIQVRDDVLVGKHYANDKYKVATYYKDNSLFKIFNVENEFLLTEDYNSEEYDRIIICGSIKIANKADEFFKKTNSLTLQKKYAKEIEGLEVYWLKGNKLVTSLNNK